MGFGQIEALRHAGVDLAFQRLPGRAPTIVWLGGFKSDMTGTKAQALSDWASRRSQAMVRFDYMGHGRSGGAFRDGTISRWLGDALAVIDAVTEGPLLLVGSSMGGWLSLLAARARPHRVKGLVLIAPAVDMTERLMWAEFSEDIRRQIDETGAWEQPSEYDPEPYVITKSLILDGRAHLLMNAPIVFDGPVHVLQGGADPDVPAAHAREAFELIECASARFDLIPDGDHRLSRPEDLARLVAAVEVMADGLEMPQA